MQITLHTTSFQAMVVEVSLYGSQLIVASAKT